MHAGPPDERVVKSRYGLQIPLPQLSVASAAVFDVYMREGRADMRLCLSPQAIAARHGHIEIFPECSKVLANRRALTVRYLTKRRNGLRTEHRNGFRRTNFLRSARVSVDTKDRGAPQRPPQDQLSGDQQTASRCLCVMSSSGRFYSMGRKGQQLQRLQHCGVGHRRLQLMFERRPSSRCPPTGNRGAGIHGSLRLRTASVVLPPSSAPGHQRL